MQNNLSIKIAGPAGFGIKVTGLILSKVFTRSGANVFAYTEYPSLIRGGHNTFQVDVADQPIRSSGEKCDILISLTWQALEKEINKIENGGIVICDNSLKHESIKALKQSKIKVISAPLIEMAKKSGSDLMKNTVALGVLMGLLDLPLEKLNGVLKDVFAAKDDAVEKNLVAAKAGYEWVKESKVRSFAGGSLDFSPLRQPADRTSARDKLILTGNQACALGVIASGCQVYVAYPMTPSTEILHILEAKQKETGMVVHQPEDEIAGIHAAIGASFAGARAATGTSGGGFALMNEGLSLAGMIEIPLVLFEVQRPAPATGNPTWSEQGDLKWVVESGHGEFAKVVITPGLPEQCFDLVQHAFNLADKFQTPVIVLSDKHLGESAFTVSRDVFDEVDKVDRGGMVKEIKKQRNKEIKELFSRYKVTQSGISPRTIPGVEGGEHIANSDEHNELSYSDEASEVRVAQMDKRMKKLEEIRKEIPLPKVYGPKNADVTLVCWGSTLGACLDTVELVNSGNVHPVKSGKAGSPKAKFDRVNVVHFSYVWPMPKGLNKFLSKFKKLVLVENNKTGQLGQLIRQETGIEIKHKILKYDSRPFWTEEIASKISTR